MRAVLEGYLEQYLIDLAMDEDDHATQMYSIAKKLRDRYMATIGQQSVKRVGLPPLEETREVVLKRLLQPEYGLNAELRGRLLTKLKLPADYGRDISTNAPTAVAIPLRAPATTNGATAGK
jgi:hypothetical protein